MLKNERWDIKVRHTLTSTKKILSNLSVYVRTDQFKIFKKKLAPSNKTEILDVGATSDEIFKDSNMFEKLYPHKNKLTIATIEDAKKVKQIYPDVNSVIKIRSHRKLPFKDKSFDVVVSWATLEHVGGYADQEFFLNELLRVGKKLFVTTPYRGCIYEPHSGFFFLHWLPLRLFRVICDKTNRKFWSTETNLNPLYVNDVSKMNTLRKVKVRVYSMFGLLPSHLLIYAK